MQPRPQLGPFKVLDLLARGGMGTVWTARHDASGTLVAIKVLHQQASADPEQLALFAKEVRAVAQIEHERVVMVLDHGTVDEAADSASGGKLLSGSPWLAMELCRGGSLKGLAPKSWPVARAILRDVLKALAFSHARGLLHRDIKPDNVLFSTPEDARPGLKLSDFGLAHVFGNSEDSKVVMGTPHYMAPEQFLGKWRDFCPATDLYGVGCLAWRMLTGATPFFEAQSQGLLAVAKAHVGERPGLFVPRFEVPSGVEAWLRRLLQKDPQKRYACAATALVALPPEVEPEERTIELSGLLDGLLDMSVNLDDLIPETTAPQLGFGEFPALPPPSLPRRNSLRLAGAGLGLFGLRRARFVGRGEVCSLLWSELRAVAETGRARVVHLRGPAGCGKSRIAWWLIRAVRELGVATHVRAVHNEDGGAGHGLTAALRETFGLGGLDAQGVRQRLEKQLAFDSGVDLDVLVPWLASDGGSVDSTERFHALAAVLASVTRDRPLVLFVDDAPWAYETVRFVEFLLEQQTERRIPVLAVLTTRDEALNDRPEVAGLLANLADLAGMTTHRLGPLGPNDAAALVDDLLLLSSDLRRRVVERSGGNPLFAVQLLSDWVARDVLEASAEGFRLRPGTRADIPADIEALCARRLADLLAEHNDEERRALVAAATLGVEVDDGEWAAACSAWQVATPTRLRDSLLRSGLARPEEGGWRFVHGLIHESLLGNILPAEEHRQAHAVCAKMLAAGQSPERAQVLERIARHWHRAGASKAAVNAFESTFHKHLESTSYNQIAHLLEEWGDALRQDQPASLPQAHGVLHWAHAVTAHHRGQPARAVPLAARAIELLAGAPRELQVKLRLVMAKSQEASGAIKESLVTSEAALEMAGGEPLLCAESYLTLAWAKLRLGDCGGAKCDLESAGQLSRNAGDPVVEITVLRRLGILSQRTKDFGASIDYLTAGLQQVRGLRMPRLELQICNDIAEAYRLQGAHEEAEAFYARSSALASRAGHMVEKQMVTINRLLMRLATEDFAAVAGELHGMREWVTRYGGHVYLLMWRAMALLCAAAGTQMGDPDLYLDALEAQLSEQGLVEYDIADLSVRAVPYLRRSGRSDLAERCLQLAAHQFELLGLADDLARVDDLR
jgi:eukaryotic-like serine/threonine-protein kinase